MTVSGKDPECNSLLVIMARKVKVSWCLQMFRFTTDLMDGKAEFSYQATDLSRTQVRIELKNETRLQSI